MSEEKKTGNLTTDKEQAFVDKKQEAFAILFEKGKNKKQLTYAMIADVLDSTDLDKSNG